MEKNKQKNENTFKLPDRLVTSVDLMRTLRELKTLDDWLNQASIRSGGQKVTAPKTSATLEELATKNGVSLLESTHRQGLINLLDSFAVNAPKIHMSFAVEPSAVFLNRMIVWLRVNVNPIVLLDVGLQPALAAGCSVRTSNKFFDMSLRNRFTDSRHFLVEAIEAVQDEVSKTQPTPKATEVPPTPQPQAQEKQPTSDTPSQPTPPQPATVQTANEVKV